METKKIFNMAQANLFIENGCRVVGVGFGRQNKVYLLFAVDETFESMMDKWNKRIFAKND